MSKDTVVAFIFGAAVGGVSTWLGVRAHYRNIEERRCEELETYFDNQVKEFEKHCRDCQNNPNVEVVEDEDIERNSSADADSQESEEEHMAPQVHGKVDKEAVKSLIDALNNGALNDTDEITAIPYDKFNARALAKASEERRAKKKQEDEEMNWDEISYIRTITPEQYYDSDDEGADYDKVELTYLEGDESFMSENFEEVSRDATLESIGGSETLGEFGEYEEGALYVRNDREQKDYCIVSDMRDAKTFIEETGGM